MHHDEPVNQPGRQRPFCILAQHRNIARARRPRHYTLRRRHQCDDTPRLCQIGPHQRRRKAEPDDCLSRHRRPHLDHLITDRPLRHPTQLRPVIEVAQVHHVQMHRIPFPARSSIATLPPGATLPLHRFLNIPAGGVPEPVGACARGEKMKTRGTRSAGSTVSRRTTPGLHCLAPCGRLAPSTGARPCR